MGRGVRTIAACAALAAGAAAVPASASARLAGFRTASGSIVCGAYTGPEPALLRCDLRGLLRPRPGRPAGCRFDFGSSLGLGATGRARVLCVSDAVLPDPGRAPVLARGRAFRDGPFTCRAVARGVRCANRPRHGFALSPARWSAF